jgi:signal transduction histidine kinase
MLDDFIVTNRESIIAGSRARVAARKNPPATDVELLNGIPVFLDQLGDAVRLARSTDAANHDQLGKSAVRHGSDLFKLGLTIGQVVHDYGDICQSITSVALLLDAPISGEEFQLLNLCLDDAIAEAATEWTRQRERAIRGQGTELLGVLAHELRNLLNGAVLAYESLRRGNIGIGGSTGQMLGRSLVGLGALIHRSLAEVRLEAEITSLEEIEVAGFLGGIEIGAMLQAETRNIQLVIAPVPPVVTIEGDRQILAAALANLLQNAFKFSHPGATVSLKTRVTEDRVLFEVEDECGGLPPGMVDDLFVPFSQHGEDRSGLGLGLAICLKAARANGGGMSVRDLPGKGCVFTLDLSRKRPPPFSLVGGEGRSSTAPHSTRGGGASGAAAELAYHLNRATEKLRRRA